ncbi:hypothetical protein QJS10_CPB18g01189 [Acorus calamus]|uniref:Uncharacterized protein n=1 Tax=Acorus calamus TaxID=4465 RepID=A0AAV9CMY7_ACOCL|nr:hypothetical protein QJS10_CPB18g01189 [Acorus calamus]
MHDTELCQPRADPTFPVDPELHVCQDKQHIFKLHKTKLIAEKLNMKVIQKRIMEEGMIMSKGKENF